ncbi:hypothetical protein CDV52_09555 [Haematobacter missouriensis]|uniref:Uncharacterized protein n=1 Tax=Haematobacter missouriensis TaxID=366616 RepID=A0A212ARL0_9RHOB|nr:hypothetical protein [Haematobacter missouriensis]OWJ84118.1 hypothetical protein CDV52_09555 [Haematobacter missouriensis]
MTPIHVASKDELLTALRAAKGGEEIVLADGDYGSLSLNGRWGANIFPYDSPVTITSATPGGASFSALTIAYGTNLAFSGIDVTGEFRATSSTGISLSDSTASKLSFRSVDGLDLSGNHVSGGITR